MVNVNGGRDWSAATKDCPDFLGSSTEVKYFTTNPNYGLGPSRPYPERSDPEPVQVLSTLGQSKNPEIQYFQKNLTKNFKVLIKRFLLGSHGLPGFLDYWIITN